LKPFDIISAQPTAWSILTRAYNSKRVASTYLFHGPAGVGHWSLAVNFAALLNCLEPQADPETPEAIRPCGQCRHCRMIYELNFEGLEIILPIGTHKNMSEAIDLVAEQLAVKRAEPFAALTTPASGTIPISLAREVSKRLSRRGEPGITRVVVFYHMDKMRLASADALLKLIEEPPADTVIILTCPRPDMLLPTIQSRSTASTAFLAASKSPV